jgi:hypothetical protein
VNREGIAFDYSSPAELLLAKPMKGSRTKYRRFTTAAEAHPVRCRGLANAQKPSAHGCRSGTSVSTAAKFNAYTKLTIIRCGLSDRAPRASWHRD